MPSPSDPSSGALDLLARWQAFSELQQRAFAFLAAEAIATGAEFEHSTEGAAQVLTRLGAGAPGYDDACTATTLERETCDVVHRLQSADRSRQGLEQVASVLETLRRLEAELTEETRRLPPLPAVESHVDAWIGELGQGISLSDWRRRFFEVLQGRDPGPRVPLPSTSDDELF